MKINGINYAISPKDNNRVTKEITQGHQHPQISPYKIFSSFDVSNRSIISFKGAGFEQTVKENYFQLKNGAEPDEYQRMAAKELSEGHDVLVTAPTGTGKTAIAHYIITKNLKDGNRTFYTTPLKALSNEKYRDLQNIYGKENVGILTGDVKINAHAPIVVMTTEVYRNMVFANKLRDGGKLSGNIPPKTVIFDELHYLGDVDRGGVWEQSIILSDKDTQLLSLSATIGNNEKINNWMSAVKGKDSVLVNVPPERRHVPLTFENLMVSSEKSDGPKGARTSAGAEFLADKDPMPDMQAYKNVVSELSKDKQLPAILFIFSKRFSKNLLNEFGKKGPMLTTKQEQKEIQNVIRRFEAKHKYLGETLNTKALSNGYAIHNSGLLPTQKELIEELFQKKLIKVVIATETLSAGINMPAKTAVISSNRKPTSAGSKDAEDGKRELTSNEFHQMAGRAGRRGIDTKGYVYTMSVSYEQKEKFDALINSSPNDLKSHFNPDFSFVAGYYKNTQNDDLIKEVLDKSLYSHMQPATMGEDEQPSLMHIFNSKKRILNDFGFIEKNNSLTDKGKLLSLLNGYHQIPIINMITDKYLISGMSPIELAAAVGAMANVDDKTDPRLNGDEPKKKTPFFHENEKLTAFVQIFDTYLDDFNDKMEQKYPTHLANKIAQDSDVARHLYKWAELNSNEDSRSRDNWKDLYRGNLHDTIRDEGTLFREITMTVDLLKQMSNIADLGIEISDNEGDKAYYSEMKSTIKESIKLLAKEPIATID